MKIKYRISDGEILAVGPFRDIQPGAGEAVEDFDGLVPDSRLDFYKRIAPGVVSEKSQAEKDAIRQKEQDDKSDRKNKKQALLTKMKLDVADLPALKALIEDGNDD